MKVFSSEAAYRIETRALSIVEHPNVLRPIGYCDDPTGGFYSIVFPMYEPVSESNIQQLANCSVLLGLAEGVRAMHAAGHVFCDIKPANVLYDASSGRAILCDLGSVASLDGGSVVATYGFYAPEQLDGLSHPTAEADVYALGLTFACIFGGVLYPTHTEPVLHTWLVRVLAQTVTHSAARSLVQRTTAPEPRSRPTMDDVVSTLRAADSEDSSVPTSPLRTAPTIALGSTEPFATHRCALSCAENIAVERSEVIALLSQQLEARQKLVLLCGPHGYGKSVAATQFCRAQEAAERSPVVTVRLPGGAVLDRVRNLLAIPAVDEIPARSLEAARGHMDRLHGQCVNAGDVKRQLLILVEDFQASEIDVLRFLARSPLVAMILATTPAECLPEDCGACRLVNLPPFTMDEVRQLAANTLVARCTRDGAPVDTGVDDASLRSLVERCQNAPFLLHRALERYNASESANLEEFIQSMDTATLTAPTRSSYANTFDTIFKLQADAFRRRFPTRGSAPTLFEHLLASCKALNVTSFDAEFLRLHMADNDSDMHNVILWMKENIGLSDKRPSSRSKRNGEPNACATVWYSLHHLQVQCAPVACEITWRLATLVTLWRNAPVDALRLVDAWITGQPDEWVAAFEPVAAAFSVAARRVAREFRCGRRPQQALMMRVRELWAKTRGGMTDSLVREPLCQVALRSAAVYVDWCCTVERWEEAETIGREAIELRTVDDETLAQLLSHVGVALERLGLRDQGFQHHQQALDMRRHLYHGIDHPDLATSLTRVGEALERREPSDEALVALRESLEMRRRLYGSADHPDLATSLGHVGAALERRGQRTEAAALADEALKMRLRIYGDTDHVDVAKSLAQCGSSLERLGKRDEGLDLQLLAVEMRRRLGGGSDSATLARSLSNRGLMLERCGRVEESAAVLKEALEMHKRLHCGGDHAELSTALMNLGSALERIGNVEDAIGLISDALEMRTRLLRGLDHPELAASQDLLGKALHRSGESERGCHLMEEALNMRRRLYGQADHPSIATSLTHIGEALERLGERGPGGALQFEALEMRSRIYAGVDHADLAHSLMAVGTTQVRWGRYDIGIQYQREALDIRRRMHRGQDHPSLARSLCSLGMSLGNADQLEEAMSRLREAHAMLLRLHRGKDHPDLVRCLATLGNVAQQQGHRELAERLLSEAHAMRGRVLEATPRVGGRAERGDASSRRPRVVDEEDSISLDLHRDGAMTSSIVYPLGANCNIA